MKKKFAAFLLLVLSLSFVSLSIAEASLSKGSKGEAVKQMQSRLIELGYLSGDADGSFGPKSESALIEFQSTVGIQQTGVCDVYTMFLLFNVSAPHRPFTMPYGITFGMSLDDLCGLFDEEFKDDPDWGMLGKWNGEGNTRTPFASTEMFGVNSINRYKFSDSNTTHLIAVRYLLETGSTTEKKVSAYDVISRNLTDILGSPIEYLDWEDRTSETLYSDDIPLAIEIGAYTMSEVWETPSVVIQHVLYKFYDDKINHIVYMYEPNENENYTFGDY